VELVDDRVVFTTYAADGTPSEQSMSGRELRCACKCAACIDEFTGALVLQKDKVPADVRPTTIAPQGNYAVAVTWSDGHKSSIYPFTLVAEVAAASEMAQILPLRS
jgi:DUF971 family protein